MRLYTGLKSNKSSCCEACSSVAKLRIQCIISYKPFIMGDYESLVAETDHFKIGMINNCPSLKTVTPIASTNCKLDSLEMVVAKIKLVPDIT